MNDDEHNDFPIVSVAAIGGASVQTVNARDLHAFLEVGKDFSTWIKDRIEAYGFTENADYVVFTEIGENPSGGRPAKEYALTLDMAKELCMVERNAKGKAARQYFIEMERRAKDPMAALNDPATMRQLLGNYAARVEGLEAKLAEDAPKVAFHDTFADKDGLYTLQNGGRIITGRPNKFIQTLKREHLFYQGGDLVPYVKYRQQGLFEVKVEVHNDRARSQTYLTPKGLQYFADKLGPAQISH